MPYAAKKYADSCCFSLALGSITVSPFMGRVTGILPTNPLTTRVFSLNAKRYMEKWQK